MALVQKVVARFPVNRSRFPDPKAGATDLPLSKILGNPSVILRASATFPDASVVSPYKAFPLRPLPAFARSVDDRPVVAAKQTEQRLDARRILEQRDRMIRFRAGRTLALNMQSRTGFDWIREGRRIRPNLPGGREGLVAAVPGPAVRGVTADAMRIPAGKPQEMAMKAMVADAIAPASLAKVEPKAAPLPAPAATGSEVEQAPANPNLTMILAVGAAVAIVFLMKRGR